MLRVIFFSLRDFSLLKLYFTDNFRFGRHIDAHKKRYIDVLGEAVAIKSVSAWADSRQDVNKMADWTAKKLEKLGAEVEFAELGDQTLHCGRIIPLPKVVLGSLGNVSIY